MNANGGAPPAPGRVLLSGRGKTRRIWIAAAAFAAFVLVVAAAWTLWPRPTTAIFFATTALADETGTFSYDRYGVALEEFVDDSGMVHYEGLKARREDLDSFGAQMAKLDPAVYRAWSEHEKIAFWTNAYNALTLVAIVEHYPIKASAATLPGFPKNSIRRIPGVWKKLEFVVMGKPTTLDAIEHQELRGTFDEPRVHVALVCAAMSCPPLRNEPFTGETLDAQLDDQAKKFLAAATNFKIDRERGAVHLSAIFKWFASDFVKSHGTQTKFAGKTDEQRAVLNFASAHLNEEDRAYLLSGKYDVRHLKYDWTLNERRTPVKSSP